MRVLQAKVRLVIDVPWYRGDVYGMWSETSNVQYGAVPRSLASWE